MCSVTAPGGISGSNPLSSSKESGANLAFGAHPIDDGRYFGISLIGLSNTHPSRPMPRALITDRSDVSALAKSEAQRQGIAVRFAKLPIAAVLRSRTLLETRGFIKVLVEANGDRILGFTMIGSEAGEIMAVGQTAMLAGYHTLGYATQSSLIQQWRRVSPRCVPIRRPANGSVGSREYHAGRCRGTHAGRRNNW